MILFKRTFVVTLFSNGTLLFIILAMWVFTYYRTVGFPLAAFRRKWSTDLNANRAWRYCSYMVNKIVRYWSSSL